MKTSLVSVNSLEGRAGKKGRKMVGSFEAAYEAFFATRAPDADSEKTKGALKADC